MKQIILFVIFAALCAVCLSQTTYTGDITYYAADGTGACSFDKSSDTLIAALNNPQWSNSGKVLAQYYHLIMHILLTSYMHHHHLKYII